MYIYIYIERERIHWTGTQAARQPGSWVARRRAGPASRAVSHPVVLPRYTEFNQNYEQVFTSSVRRRLSFRRRPQELAASESEIEIGAGRGLRGTGASERRLRGSSSA